jgi:hypothetical protein
MVDATDRPEDWSLGFLGMIGVGIRVTRRRTSMR